MHVKRRDGEIIVEAAVLVALDRKVATLSAAACLSPLVIFVPSFTAVARRSQNSQ